MKPIDPKTHGQYVNFAADQPEYHPLPARVQDGIAHTRWQLTWRERLAVLFGRRLDLELMTFGRPLQPILPYVEGMEPKEEPHAD